jgi:hypothetical protein
MPLTSLQFGVNRRHWWRWQQAAGSTSEGLPQTGVTVRSRKPARSRPAVTRARTERFATRFLPTPQLYQGSDEPDKRYHANSPFSPSLVSAAEGTVPQQQLCMLFDQI